MKTYLKYDHDNDTWLDSIPESWEIKRLKEISELQNGVSRGSSYFGQGYPFVSYSDIYNDRIELNNIKGLANSSKEDQNLYSVLEGDIFFTRTSETIDEIGISATCLKTIPKATFSGFTIIVRPHRLSLIHI